MMSDVMCLKADEKDKESTAESPLPTSATISFLLSDFLC
jgi:hypothetical protein